MHGPWVPTVFEVSCTQLEYGRPAATFTRMTLSVSPRQTADLRTQPVEDVLGRVGQTLQVLLLSETVVRKRRTVGARTDRDTWVRIERRSLDKIPDQGWNGAESAARLGGVAQQTCTVRVCDKEQRLGHPNMPGHLLLRAAPL